MPEGCGGGGGGGEGRGAGGARVRPRGRVAMRRERVVVSAEVAASSLSTVWWVVVSFAAQRLARGIVTS